MATKASEARCEATTDVFGNTVQCAKPAKHEGKHGCTISKLIMEWEEAEKQAEAAAALN
jgi:hypothetical protein